MNKINLVQVFSCSYTEQVSGHIYWSYVEKVSLVYIFFFSRRYAAKRCATCSQTIDCAEMVMRARDCVFHLECFACVQCKRVLTTGDSFGMNGNKVYCHADFQTFVVQKQARRKKENGEGRSRKRKHDALSCDGQNFFFF